MTLNVGTIPEDVPLADNTRIHTESAEDVALALLNEFDFLTHSYLIRSFSKSRDYPLTR